MCEIEMCTHTHTQQVPVDRSEVVESASVASIEAKVHARHVTNLRERLVRRHISKLSPIRNVWQRPACDGIEDGDVGQYVIVLSVIHELAVSCVT